MSSVNAPSRDFDEGVVAGQTRTTLHVHVSFFVGANGRLSSRLSKLRNLATPNTMLFLRTLWSIFAFYSLQVAQWVYAVPQSWRFACITHHCLSHRCRWVVSACSLRRSGCWCSANAACPSPPRICASTSSAAVRLVRHAPRPRVVLVYAPIILT